MNKSKPNHKLATGISPEAAQVMSDAELSSLLRSRGVDLTRPTIVYSDGGVYYTDVITDHRDP